MGVEGASAHRLREGGRLMSDPESPGDSLRDAMATDPRDWSVYKRDAWYYAIVCGWDDSLEEVAAQHGWTEGTIARVRRLHEKFKAAFPEDAHAD